MTADTSNDLYTENNEQQDGGFKSGFAPVNGISMYYEIHGSGEVPLVLIHGGGSTIETTFGDLLPMLAAYHQVIALELQAHGRTSYRAGTTSFEQDADDVAALLRFLQVSKANIFGFSNGGNTTMQIAIRHPELVSNLIIASAFFKRSGMFAGFFDGMLTATLNDMPADLQAGHLKLAPGQEGLEIMFEQDRQRMASFTDWPNEHLQRISAPALLVAGDRDVVSVEHTLEMASLLANGRLAILPAGHGDYLFTSPAAYMPGVVVNLVNAFLQPDESDKTR